MRGSRSVFINVLAEIEENVGNFDMRKEAISQNQVWVIHSRYQPEVQTSLSYSALGERSSSRLAY